MNNDLIDYEDKVRVSFDKEENRNIEYPCLIVDRVTNVELRNWIRKKVLFNTKIYDDAIPLYLCKNNDMMLIGYIVLNLRTLTVLSNLYKRKFKLKKNASEDSENSAELMYSVALLS